MSEEIRSAFDSAADFFDSGPLSFWDRIGKRSVSLAQIGRGGAVLDVGCGSGASVFPAAEAVGTDGRVVGVDWRALRCSRILIWRSSAPQETQANRIHDSTLPTLKTMMPWRTCAPTRRLD